MLVAALCQKVPRKDKLEGVLGLARDACMHA
jgi:hypothetical protein